ncbi:MAG: hypothetical protein U0326_07285 [Polyangiales bacterium]
MDLLIGVGGGGQHVALTVARMVRLGVWTSPPRVLVIDADEESNLAKRLKTFGGTAPGVPHPLTEFSFMPPLAKDKAGSLFRSAFLPSADGASSVTGSLEEELYELFYNEAADKVEIKKGMAAQPSVGAAVFSDLGISHLKSRLEGEFGKVDRVLITSSFIGGTGAGVTHSLVKFLAGSPYRKGKEIFGSFLLRWLQLPGGTSSASDQTITNSESHGIQHFVRETAPRLARSTLIGANGDAKLAMAHPGEDETASVYPLLAAYGLAKLPYMTADAKGGDNIRTMTAPRGADMSWILSEEWPLGKQTIAERWAAAKVLDALLDLYFSNDGGTEFRDLEGDAFKETGILGVGERENWGTAIRRWAKSKTMKDVALAAQVLMQLRARQQQLKVVTLWLHEVFGAQAESRLSRVGSNELQGHYEQRQKLSKSQAYRYLDSALAHRRGVLKVEDARDPAPYLAQMIEEALMEEMLKGKVIS